MITDSYGNHLLNFSEARSDFPCRDNNRARSNARKDETAGGGLAMNLARRIKFWAIAQV